MIFLLIPFIILRKWKMKNKLDLSMQRLIYIFTNNIFQRPNLTFLKFYSQKQFDLIQIFLFFYFFIFYFLFLK